MKPSRLNWLALGGAGILLLLFTLQGLAFIRASGQTSDEAVHLVAGYSYLTRHDFRLSPDHPPLIEELSALLVYIVYRIPFQPDERLWSMAEQWQTGRDFLYRSPVSWERILSVARLPNLLLGALLCALMGWWAFRLWGPAAALVAMGLSAFEPNLIAHSGLVTADIGAALFIFLTVYLLWEYVQSPSWPRLAGVAVATGLGLVSKFSCVLLVGILPGVALLHVMAGGALPLPGTPKTGARGGAAARALEAVAPLFLILLAAALVIPFAYLLAGGSEWLVGLKGVLTHQRTGHMAFFWGEYSTKGWWLYFPVAVLIKTPVGTLLMMLASIVLWRVGKTPPHRDTIFLFLPVVLLFVVASGGKLNIGLRHILPVYPFLIVAASRLASLRLPRPGWWAALLIAPIALTAVSSLRAAPYQLAYFNELVGGPGEGYRYLSDSNIDWGQALKELKQYMDREGLPMIYLSSFSNAPPSALGIRYQYVPAFGHLDRPALDTVPEGSPREILAVSVTNLQGVYFKDKNLFRWLYRRTPVAKIGFAIYVYDITGDAEAHLRLAEAYLRMGPRALAVPELRKVLAQEPGNAEAARLLAELASSP